MSKKTGKTGSKAPSNYNYRRNSEKGYQPIRGKLDTSNPPKSGSGIPSKSSKDTGGNNKKD